MLSSLPKLKEFTEGFEHNLIVRGSSDRSQLISLIRIIRIEDKKYDTGFF